MSRSRVLRQTVQVFDMNVQTSLAPLGYLSEAGWPSVLKVSSKPMMSRVYIHCNHDTSSLWTYQRSRPERSGWI